MRDCQQEALNNNWQLDRVNACHISNANDEMGDVKDSIESIEGEMMTMNFNIQSIANNLGMFNYIGGAIFLSIIALVIKKMWGNGKK